MKVFRSHRCSWVCKIKRPRVQTASANILERTWGTLCDLQLWYWQIASETLRRSDCCHWTREQGKSLFSFWQSGVWAWGLPGTATLAWLRRVTELTLRKYRSEPPLNAFLKSLQYFSAKCISRGSSTSQRCWCNCKYMFLISGSSHETLWSASATIPDVWVTHRWGPCAGLVPVTAVVSSSKTQPAQRCDAPAALYCQSRAYSSSVSDVNDQDSFRTTAEKHTSLSLNVIYPSLPA